MSILSNPIEEVRFSDEFELQIRTCRLSRRSVATIQRHIDNTTVPKSAELSELAEWIYREVVDMYWDYWAAIMEVDSSNLTFELSTIGSRTWAIHIEGPDPDAISMPLSFTLSGRSTYDEP